MKPRAVATELVVAIAARAAPSYGRSTLTPAVSDVNVLTQEWPELAACRRFVTSLEWRLFVARPRNRPYE
jgi:hypothetical protein